MSKDYYIISNGSVKRKDNTIYYYDLEGDKKALPIEQIDDIHVNGNMFLYKKWKIIMYKYSTFMMIYLKNFLSGPS